MVAIQDSQPAIEVQNLFRFFDTTRAVDDISFAVMPSEAVGFIGPNGAGKTTTMRILSTLDQPDSGNAFVDGFSVVDDPDRVCKRLGFMPDSFGSYPNINCIEYIDFFGRAYGLMGRDRTRASARVVSLTGLAPLANKPIVGLSKGMKQRLCLARALIHDPQVLILDEPAAGLDPRARIEFREVIRHLGSEGKSLLISSHILTELSEMCDRMIIIEQGKMIADGTIEEISRIGLDESAVATTMEIDVQVVGNTTRLVSWLNQNDAVSSVQVDGGQLLIETQNSQQVCVDLLRDIVEAKFSISSFAPRQQSLEDVFLRVTKGRVQ